MLFSDVTAMVGSTPVVKLNYPVPDGVELFIKLEGANPTGSVKDRAALNIIQDKIATGELRPGKTILDASSGSFACAISYFGHVLGYPVTVVTGSKMTEDKAGFVAYFGAERISLGDFTIEGNRHCREVVLPQNPEKYCFLDQLHNWKNVDASYLTMGPEVLADLPDVAAVVFSLGSGGTLCGLSRYIKEHKPDTKVVAVTAASGSKIPGTGAFDDGDYMTPFIKELLGNGQCDYKAVITANQAAERVLELKHEGIYVGIQTGGVLQGALDAMRELDLQGKVLIISGDAGWKNMDKLTKL